MRQHRHWGLTSDTPLPQNDDEDEMPALQPVSYTESESGEEESDEDAEDGGGELSVFFYWKWILTLAFVNLDVYSRTQNPCTKLDAEWPVQSISPTTNADQPPPTTTATSMGSGRIEAKRRINRWRLYRFPPILSPSAAGVVVGHTGGSRSGSNTDAQASTGTTSADLAINSNNTETATLSTSSASESNQQPIVVGLQSVRSLDGGDYNGNEVGFHDGHGQ